MIKQLTITNFRCYKKSTILFNGTSILVGKNNAGKSTMIEALKIISSVTRKYKTARFTMPPEWLDNITAYGISPNVENMNISDRGIFNMYGNPPAVIEAVFTNGTSIKAYVGELLSIFAVIYDEDGCVIRNNKEAKSVDIPLIEVLPQISAVLDTERLLKKNTVDSNRSTRLASRNFRNQLYHYSDAFPTFKTLAESTWEKLKVSPAELTWQDGENNLHFFVRVNTFEAEIGWMGHGLQMWIQTMWFISQCPPNAIVVLDEPDVYMHADLQRRLVRLVMPMFRQLIIATHSLEIIEEVTSDCIIPVDSTKKTVRPIGEETSLQFLAKQLGSPFNIDLARVFISNLFILWDGDDTSRKLLSAFQSVLYPQELYPLINVPKAFIEGWDDWGKVVMFAKLLAENKIKMKLLCILSSHNHSKDEIKERNSEAKDNGVNIHIWEKKELENYAINPDVIYRYITKNKIKGNISKDIVNKTIRDIIDNMDSACINKAKKQSYNLVNGRDFFDQLSLWTQKEYGISISARQVVSYFQIEEVPEEIKKVINKIMKLQ